MRKPAEKFHGNPCRNGHVGVRYRTSGGCMECSQDASDRRRQEKILRAEALP